MRLHLIELLLQLGIPSPTASALPILCSPLAPIDSNYGPLKNTLWIRLPSDTCNRSQFAPLRRVSVFFGGPFGSCTRVLIAILLPSTNFSFAAHLFTVIYTGRYFDTAFYYWSDPPPRLENVETIVSIRTQWLPQLHQWQNCNLDSFRIPPCFQLDHGIQQQGHCDYWTHDQHD